MRPQSPGGDRRRHRVPAYRLHKPSGKAVVTLTDAFGRRHDVRLGEYGSPASRAAYDRVIAEWKDNGRRLAVPVPAEGLSVNELAVRFLTEFAEKHYRRADGTPTNELADIKLSIRPLRKLYGDSRAGDFGPKKLKAVRQAMIDADLCRGVINQRVGRIRRMFKWAVAEEIVAPAIHQALAALKGIPRGRGQARETEPIRPVPVQFVDAILDHVLPEVAAMIDLQRLTGMRPGEVCSLRAIDIDTAGAVWVYRPHQHKTLWRGKDRAVAIGPQAQAVIRRFLPLETHAAVFSPARALAERALRLRAARKTPVQPSQQDRSGRPSRRKPGSKHKPPAPPGEWYTSDTYLVAVRRGCDRADRAARQRAEDETAAAEGRLPATVPNLVEVDDPARIIPRWHQTSFATITRPTFAGGTAWKAPKSRWAIRGRT